MDQWGTVFKEVETAEKVDYPLVAEILSTTHLNLPSEGRLRVLTA